MPKPVIAIIASLLIVLAIAILSFSFGWYLMVLLVLLIPATYIHLLALVKTIKWAPQFYPVVFLSGFTLIAFSLFRPDSDSHGDFSGYSALLFKLGAADKPYVEVWTYALEACLLLLLIMVYLDVFLLTRVKRARKSKALSES